MSALFSEKVYPSKSKGTPRSAQINQHQVYKDTQKNKLIIPKKTFDTSAARILQQIEQRDSKRIINKTFQKQEPQSIKSFPDSLWNIYTGNPGLYSTEGDTTGFGNVEFLSDSLFQAKLFASKDKSSDPYGIEGKAINIPKQDWLLGILLVAWILFASVRSGFNKYFDLLFGSLIKASVANRLYRERGYKTLYGALRLNFVFYIIIPLAVFQILDFYQVKIPGYSSYILFLILLISINGFFIIKNMLYQAIGSVILLQEEIDESVFNIYLYYKGLAIFLLPVVTLHAIEKRITFVTLWIIVFLIVIFYFVSIIRSIYIGNRKGVSIFYLILYLCLLEILPLILIYKIITTG